MTLPGPSCRILVARSGRNFEEISGKPRESGELSVTPSATTGGDLRYWDFCRNLGARREFELRLTESESVLGATYAEIRVA